MEVEGSTTFSMGGNCCYVGRERPWRVLESSTRIQSFGSMVDEMVGGVAVTFFPGKKQERRDERWGVSRFCHLTRKHTHNPVTPHRC